LEDPRQNAGLDSVQTETLARRLARGALPLSYALQCAADIANSLRGMHEEGRLHGSVDARSVIVTGAGAQLIPPHGQARNISAGADVRAFGTLFQEMLTGSIARNPENGIKTAAARLASKCLRSTSNSASEMQEALAEVRHLIAHARIHEKASADAVMEAPKPEIHILFPAISQPPTYVPPARGVAPPIFTPVPAGEFMAGKNAGSVDPPPSGVKCPGCGAPYVYPSRTRTWFEVLLAAWGSPTLRCHRCLYRYVVILRRFTFAKNLSNT
jgi:hypothetical protein